MKRIEKFLTAITIFTLLNSAHAGVFLEDFNFDNENNKTYQQLVTGLNSCRKDFSDEVFAGFGMASLLLSKSGIDYKNTIDLNEKFYKHYQKLNDKDRACINRGIVLYSKYYFENSYKIGEWFESAKKNGVFPKSIIYSDDFFIAQKYLSGLSGFTDERNLYSKYQNLLTKLGGVRVDKDKGDKKLFDLMTTFANAATKNQEIAMNKEIKELIKQFEK